MTFADTLTEFEAVKDAFCSTRDAFAVACQRAAFHAARAEFPTVHVLKVEGDNEGSDFTPRLRVQQILDEAGTVLFDINECEDDDLADRIHEIGIEILDYLIEYGAGEWFGTDEIYGPDEP